VPDHQNPQLLNRYSYAGNNPIRYNDPDGHCGPLCWTGIVLGLSRVALTVNASQPLPPEKQPSDIQGLVGTALMLTGLGLQVPEWLIPLACGDGNCTNEVEQGTNVLCGGDCSDELRTNGQVLKEGLAYRGGSATPSNLTPRPGIDLDGLSTFNNLKSAAAPGNKAQVIDISKLSTPLQAIFDDSPPGHISIRPSDLSLIPEWAATRGTDFIHPFTKGVMDAIIGVERVPK